MIAFFDLDGCLVDSRAAIAASMNHALTSLGFDARPAKALYPYVGPPLREAFVEMLGGERHADHAVDLYREMYRERSLVDTVACDGVADALAELAHEVRLVVVTTKPGVFATPILDAVGMAKYFRGVFAPSLAARAETKSETLRRAVVACGLDATAPEHAWMIGDRRYDVEAGRALGLATVGVTWGIGGTDELTAAGADHIVTAPQHLPALVLGGHRQE